MDLLVLSGTDVDNVIQRFTPSQLVALMARVFTDLASSRSSYKSANTVTIPHRSVIPSTHHHTLFMPSRLASVGTAVKIVSGPTATAPAEVKDRGLPASTAVLDEQTGEVVALVNARMLTALRNAASSLLASQLMLTDTPTELVAIGAGAQIAAHASLFFTSYPTIRKCTIFNRMLNARLTGLVQTLQNAHKDVDVRGFPLSTTSQPSEGEYKEEHPELRQALEHASIVITATSSTKALFPSCYIRPGTHLCLIGSYTPDMHEVETDLIKRASKVVVDYTQGVLVEAGEIISAEITEDSLTELGELIQFDDPNHWSPREDRVREVKHGDVTIFKSVGVGIQDVAIARAVVDSAKEHGIGTVIGGYS